MGNVHPHVSKPVPLLPYFASTIAHVAWHRCWLFFMGKGRPNFIHNVWSLIDARITNGLEEKFLNRHGKYKRNSDFK